MAILEIKVPLHPAYKSDLHRIDYFESAVDDLMSLNGNLKFNIANHPSLDVQITKTIDTSRKHYSDLNKVFSSELIFKIEISNIPISYRYEFSPDQKPEDNLNQYQFELMLDICNRIFHLLVFSNISKPGAIKAIKGNVYRDGQLCYQSFPAYSLHREGFEDLETLNWIKFHDLHIKDVIEWFERNSFTFDKHSSSSTGRALNAFTKLFSGQSRDLTFDLFWSLIGNEALFCNTSEGISHQIYEKTQVLFGPLVNFKKRIKTMYNFRSKLIHGSMDFAPENHFDETPEEWKFQDELFESTILSIAILTGALQELIIKNKSTFEFRYSLV